MSQFIENVQETLKRNSQNIGIFIFRSLSGLTLGLTLTLIFQQVLGYGELLYWFIIFLSAGAFLRSTKGWRFVSVVALDFVLVLIALILKMYILIAPGA